jgi:hypothetical protein
MIYQSNILAELEIEVCDEPDVYVIDADSQKKVKDKLQLTSELDDWTKEDECYCMIFKRKLDNQAMSDVAFDNILKSGVPRLKLYMESRDLSILIHLINMILLQRKMLRIKL